MPRLLLFCVFLLCGTVVWSADYQQKIHWFTQSGSIDSGGVACLRFEGCIVQGNSQLPYWFGSFGLKSSTAEVIVKDAVYELFQDSLIPSDCFVPNDLQYTTEIGVSAGHSILRITLLPFVRKNDQIVRLVSFTISVTEVSGRLKSAVTAYNWKPASVLENGKWIKIKTKSKGIYKITYDQLRAWGFSGPEQVAMYGNGGLMLPVMNKDIAGDDLSPYPVWKGKDNANRDCLFFYSTGNISLNENPETGMLTHQQNYYSAETYFYLSDQGGVRTIDKAAEPDAAAGQQVTSFPNYAFYEKEAVNLIASGSQWFGEVFPSGSSHTVNLSLERPDMTKAAQFSVSAAGRSAAQSSMSVFLNGKLEKNVPFDAIDVSDPTTDYADHEISGFTEILSSSNLQVKLTYNASNSSSGAWLDYVAVNYQSLLTMNGDVCFFRGKGNSGAVPVSEFAMNGATPAIKIFDVTDIGNSFEMPVVFADGQARFKSDSQTTREYVAFNPGGSIPEPEWVEAINNQNLHGSEPSEMIIVSSPAFLSAANDLAGFHRAKDQMTVRVVTPEMIYNEFSGGLPDPSGIRNYFRMCYTRGNQSGENRLKYVMLMGDGSYDNRNILNKKRNLIPTFQSVNSLSPTESFVTDDFFAFLDEHEGGAQGTVDLGIGRIPAFTLEEAEVVVDKIKNYDRQVTMGNWRNVVTFIGDDEDGNTHMGQAEGMADFVNKTYPAFFTDKIYFDAYKQISTSGGERYPDVTAAINARVKQGTLVMNYTGHANEKSLADENVLDIGTVKSWTNYNRLPVFVTATCEYSRFDGDETSAGEHILLNPWGGGVGLFSTTRLVYSGANFILNSQFFKYVFEKDQQGNSLRLGDVMRLAKAAANTGTNQLNFTLLADPAMRLANPVYQVKTASINGKDTETETDTLRALSKVTVKGFVADNNGGKLTSFSGEIIPTVYDKAVPVKTLGNAGQTPMNYTLRNNIIYRGLATVTNGDFEFSFFVPKDVSYKLDKGKILYYAYNESVDAQGYFDGFYLGGAAGSPAADTEGPEIELFMNSNTFKEGGTVSANSVLLAYIADLTGINTSGIGIGHDITAVLDGDYSNIMVLNDYFQADKDRYSSGRIVFPVTNLAEGEHTLTVKVWDVWNNSSEKEIRFVVKDDFRIESVSCYPNPMHGQTRFVFTHNQPDETFEVTLEVFQTSGARVDMLRTTLGSSGTESLPLEWTPAGRLVKMKPGVYVYRLSVETNGKKSSASGRLVFLYR
ncbi:MAG: type IX secretion system sortase PorU [Prolixibacteraceae bacterium]|nr:type IX secretion system sortase PorU [Prolixibacteraceae bacterium]